MQNKLLTIYREHSVTASRSLIVVIGPTTTIDVSHARYLPNPGLQLRALLVSKKITKLPKSHIPRTNWNDKRNTGRGKRKAYLVEEDIEGSEEQFGPEKDIDYYDPDMHEEENQFLDEEPDADFTSAVTSLAKPIDPQCFTCLVHFTSNNKLHHHVRKDNCKREIQITHAVTQKTSLQVSTASPATPPPGSPSASPLTSLPKASPYLTHAKSLTPRLILIEKLAPDTGLGDGNMQQTWYCLPKQKSSSMLSHVALALGLVSPWSIEIFFQRQASPRISIRTMASPITVRGIGTTQHTMDEYAIVPFMFEGTQKGQPVLTSFWREVHLVDNLKANLLIGIDVMGPELVTADMGQKKVIFGSCNVEIPIEIKSRSRSAQGVQRPVHGFKN